MSDVKFATKRRWINGPVGRGGQAAILAFFLLLPGWMFREALVDYRLHSDDFEYLAGSRTPARAVANLFRPHNTHIVPAWRVLTATLVQVAGVLPRLQETLAVATYAALVILMILVGVLVGREFGRLGLGLAALIATGTTSVLFSSGTWYSSGQTVWAAIGIVGMLVLLQAWRICGGSWRLVAGVGLAWMAGGFWTIGHAAGPVGFVYLWMHGRRRAAFAPLMGTIAAVAIAWTLGGRHIDARISFHGRSEREAASPLAGLTHTLQAIPEQLGAENLGLETETTVLQGAGLCALIAVVWLLSIRAEGGPNPLEAAGGALIVIAYFVEWTFRGYLPFSSLRGIVPWYDTIPHVGLALFGTGWIGRMTRDHPSGLTRGGAVGLLAFSIGLAVVHQSRIESLLMDGVPQPGEGEPVLPPTREFRLLRARYLWPEYHRVQRLDLARLQRAEGVGRRLSIGRDTIHEVFGRIEVLELPSVYDALGLLDLPETGMLRDPAQVRAALGEVFQPSVPPRIPGGEAQPGLPGMNQPPDD